MDLLKQVEALEASTAKVSKMLGDYADYLTVRDQFAIAALKCLDIQAHVARPAAEHLAKSAYEIADAMLAARNPT